MRIKGQSGATRLGLGGPLGWGTYLGWVIPGSWFKKVPPQVAGGMLYLVSIYWVLVTALGLLLFEEQGGSRSHRKEWDDLVG